MITGLYPIIRRVRRPLLPPEETPCRSRREEASEPSLVTSAPTAPVVSAGEALAGADGGGVLANTAAAKKGKAGG